MFILLYCKRTHKKLLHTNKKKGRQPNRKMGKALNRHFLLRGLSKLLINIRKGIQFYESSGKHIKTIYCNATIHSQDWLKNF